MNNLIACLNTFAEKHVSCSVGSDIFDTAHCFDSYPKNYVKNDVSTTVATYVIKGYPFVKKYDLKFHKLTPKPFDLELQVIGTLCLKPLANTSLHEVKDVIERYDRRVQGWNKKTLYNIINALRVQDSSFDPSVDSAFFFGGKSEMVYDAARLHQIWFNNILENGSKINDFMDAEQVNLFEKIFPIEVAKGDTNAILKNSYFYGTPNYLSLSTEYLNLQALLYRLTLRNNLITSKDL